MRHQSISSWSERNNHSPLPRQVKWNNSMPRRRNQNLIINHRCTEVFIVWKYQSELAILHKSATRNVEISKRQANSVSKYCLCCISLGNGLALARHQAITRTDACECNCGAPLFYHTRQKMGQVMAWRGQTPRHYLNQWDGQVCKRDVTSVSNEVTPFSLNPSKRSLHTTST